MQLKKYMRHHNNKIDYCPMYCAEAPQQISAPFDKTNCQEGESFHCPMDE